MSLRTTDAASSVETVPAPAIPEWQVRENALWCGLSQWIREVHTACDMPDYSLLLPPRVQLESNIPPTMQTEQRVLGGVGRKSGLAALRCLFGGPDTQTNFFVEAEHPYAEPHDISAHLFWVVEDEDTVLWTAHHHPEVLLADRHDSNGEPMVVMYLRQACVLYRMKGAQGRATASSHADGVDGQGPDLRLLRFVSRCASANESSARNAETVLLGSTAASTPPKATSAAPAVSGVGGGGGALEGIPLHAPLRHAHCGCRVTPLSCDELVLGVAWPAEAIVDYLPTPPLREAIDVYCAKRFAIDAVLARIWRMEMSDTTVQGVVDALVADLRRELLLVLTDTATMEQREFYGDGLLDYCVAVATLSFRHATADFSIWRGGNITEGSTSHTLATRALPKVLRDYWMSRRRICNDKRLADCVEGLFGALSMSLWVLPLRRHRRALEEMWTTGRRTPSFAAQRSLIQA